MDVVLTGRILSADEALAHGVVSRVSEPEKWLELACEVAQVIAGRSAIASKLAKQAVKTSFETGLTAGLVSESNAFAMAFSSDDGQEGVDAFLNKREPGWTHV
jgi:enoyl-CoA hydratase